MLQRSGVDVVVGGGVVGVAGGGGACGRCMDVGDGGATVCIYIYIYVDMCMHV